MEKTLTKKSFPAWVKKLSAYEIYAPVEKGGVWNYEPAADLKEISPGYPNTVQAPKKIVLPQTGRPSDRVLLTSMACQPPGNASVNCRWRVM